MENLKRKRAVSTSREDRRLPAGGIVKTLLVYLPTLAAMGLAAWRPALGWLNPLAMLILLGGAIWMWHSEGRAFRDLGLQRAGFWRQDLGWGLLIGLSLPLALQSLLALSGSLTLTPATQTTSVLVGLLGAVVKPALTVSVEELAFRGCFLQRLELDHGARPAVALSSLLFALAHVPPMLRSGLPPVSLLIGLSSWFAFGTALGLGFLYTGSRLWFPWGLHYAYNLGHSAIVPCAAVVYNSPITLTYAGPPWQVGHPAWAPESGLLGLLLQMAILAAVWAIGQTRRGERRVERTNGEEAREQG